MSGDVVPLGHKAMSRKSPIARKSKAEQAATQTLMKETRTRTARVGASDVVDGGAANQRVGAKPSRPKSPLLATAPTRTAMKKITTKIVHGENEADEGAVARSLNATTEKSPRPTQMTVTNTTEMTKTMRVPNWHTESCLLGRKPSTSSCRQISQDARNREVRAAVVTVEGEAVGGANCSVADSCTKLAAIATVSKVAVRNVVVEKLRYLIAIVC